MIKVLSCLLDVELCARRCWSLDRFLSGHRLNVDDLIGHEQQEGEESDDDIDGLHVGKKSLRKVDEAMKSGKFWGCVFIVWSYDHGMENVAGWCEDCPCHPDELLQATRWHRQKRYLTSAGIEGASGCTGRKASKPCLAKGAKAPNVAAGEHLALLKHQLDNAVACVLRHLPRDVTNDERDELVLNMNAGRARAIKTFTTKTHYWFELPHFLAILAHRNPRKVSDGAALLIQKYDQSPMAVMHHRLSIFFLDSSGPARVWVIELSRGSELSNCPLWFQLAVLRMLLIIIVERRVEDMLIL